MSWPDESGKRLWDSGTNMTDFRFVPARAFVITLALFGLSAMGCSNDADGVAPNETQIAPPIPLAPAGPEETELTVDALRARLRASNPQMNENVEIRKAGGEIRVVKLYQAGVTDITPLAGLPLRELDLGTVPVSDLSPLAGMPLQSLILEDTQVSDLSVLEGMPLRVLYLQNTPVSDISALADMELRELNLFGTKVTDISVVQTMPLSTLWLRDTSVSDLSPLRGKYLESLDIAETGVGDLSVLADMTSLKRLNMARSQVTDLTPLAGLQLERLVFSPALIQEGLDVARNMTSLREIGVTFETRMQPSEFWAQYDAGQVR